MRFGGRMKQQSCLPSEGRWRWTCFFESWWLSPSLSISMFLTADDPLSWFPQGTCTRFSRTAECESDHYWFFFPLSYSVHLTPGPRVEDSWSDWWAMTSFEHSLTVGWEVTVKDPCSCKAQSSSLADKHTLSLSTTFFSSFCFPLVQLPRGWSQV